MPSNPPVHATRASRAPALLIVLLLNAIPIAGVLVFGWSGANLLALYWSENLLVAIATGIRIATHRRVTRKRGHQRAHLGLRINDRPFRGGLGAEYRTAAFVFTLAHGVFVGVMLFALQDRYPEDPVWQLRPRELGLGVLLVATLLTIDLLLDLPRLGRRSFAWMRDYARSRLGRVVVLHLTIILGMAAMVMLDLPAAVLVVLAGLKLLSELGMDRDLGASPAASGAPPRWALALAERVARNKGGADGFARKFAAEQARAAQQAADDEIAISR